MEQKYSAIVFDLGNVLLPFDYSIILDNFEKVRSGLGKNFADFYKSNYGVHRKFERGDLSEEKFTDTMLNVLDHEVTKQEFYRIYSEIFTVNEELVGKLPILKRKYELVLLSNTNSIHQKYGWGSYSFLSNFDKLVLSHEVLAVKPEEKIYRAVEAFTSVPSDEHFYIDDVLEYVNAAKTLGWHAAQFVGNDALFGEFRRRGIRFE